MQFDMTRAWKDEEYRQSLSQEQQAQVPASPAGEIELSEAELEQINGTGAGGGIGGGYGAGNGVYKEDYGVSAFGVKNNSYYCGNFSIRPRTNVNLGSTDNGGGILSSALSGAASAISSLRNNNVTRQNTNFDFSCSLSGGFSGTCIFGGK